MAGFLENSPRNLTAADFKSILDMDGGLAKSCRFVATIMPGRMDLPFLGENGSILRDLMYLCEATQFPGRGFNNLDVRYYGPNHKVPFQTAYEDITMTFLCRSAPNFPERMFFDNWLEYINPTTTFDFNYQDNYTAEITLYQFADFTSTGDETAPDALYEFSLLDAWPVLVNAQDVSWADDTAQRLTVSFSYSQWRRKGINNTPAANTGFSLVDQPNVEVLRNPVRSRPF